MASWSGKPCRFFENRGFVYSLLWKVTAAAWYLGHSGKTSNLPLRVRRKSQTLLGPSVHGKTDLHGSALRRRYCHLPRPANITGEWNRDTEYANFCRSVASDGPNVQCRWQHAMIYGYIPAIVRGWVTICKCCLGLSRKSRKWCVRRVPSLRHLCP